MAAAAFLGALPEHLLPQLRVALAALRPPAAAWGPGPLADCCRPTPRWTQQPARWPAGGLPWWRRRARVVP